MKLIDLFISARRDVLQLLASTADSLDSLGWDRTRPNSATKYHIDEFLKKQIDAAGAFGIHLVTRHSPCGAVTHGEYYLVESKSIELKGYEDSRFDWTSEQLYQGPRVCSCPCAPKKNPTSHHVIDEFVISKNGTTRRHPIFVDALAWVGEARNLSVQGKSRSAIREGLLRALIVLNDGIFPQSVDEYIAASDVGTL